MEHINCFILCNPRNGKTQLALLLIMSNALTSNIGISNLVKKI